MSIKDLIKRSRSYRRFDAKHRISQGTLIELAELARLSPCMRNQQAIKFMLSCDKEKNDLIFPSLSWAGALKDWKGPDAGERPAAYVILLGDTEVSVDYGPDHGIAAQSMLLGAVEKGLGGCMIGSIDRGLLRKNLNIHEQFKILLVVALGKPNEKVMLEDLAAGGSTAYYRDKEGTHHVPKRTLRELIIK